MAKHKPIPTAGPLTDSLGDRIAALSVDPRYLGEQDQLRCLASDLTTERNLLFEEAKAGRSLLFRNGRIKGMACFVSPRHLEASQSLYEARRDLTDAHRGQLLISRIPELGAFDPEPAEEATERTKAHPLYNKLRARRGDDLPIGLVSGSGKPLRVGNAVQFSDHTGSGLIVRAIEGFGLIQSENSPNVSAIFMHSGNQWCECFRVNKIWESIEEYHAELTAPGKKTSCSNE